MDRLSKEFYKRLDDLYGQGKIDRDKIRKSLKELSDDKLFKQRLLNSLRALTVPILYTILDS